MLKKTLRFFHLILRSILHKPSNLKHIAGIALWAAEQISDPEADIRDFDTVDISSLSRSPARLSIQIFPNVPASISPLESAALATLINKINAKKIFEFGTYKGVSTTQLALNIQPDGHVYTLDLPENHPAYSLNITKKEERQIAQEAGKGVLIPDILRDHITFLRHDSATFDTFPYENMIDITFIDGAHSFDYVKNDSIKAWKMLKCGGIAVWHDCNPNHRDVVRYLRSHPHKVTLIKGTSLAFSIKE